MSFGFAANENSAMPCGCDPGCGPGGYLCERHRATHRVMMIDPTQVLFTTPEVDMKAYHDMVSLPVGIGGAPTAPSIMPTDPIERKKYPVFSGVLQYFPDAILEVARVSWEGNNQHNPGMPLHWDRSKSSDEPDACLRHMMTGGIDTDGRRHLAKAAWRILAMLQKEIEADQGK